MIYEELEGTIHRIRVGHFNLHLQLFHRENSLALLLIYGARGDQDTRQFLAGIENLINLALDSGIEADKIYNCLLFQRGESFGATGNKHVPMALGILDAIGKLLKEEYPEGRRKREA